MVFFSRFLSRFVDSGFKVSYSFWLRILIRYVSPIAFVSNPNFFLLFSLYWHSFYIFLGVRERARTGEAFRYFGGESKKYQQPLGSFTDGMRDGNLIIGV